jgi:hypothetical protein
MARGDAYRNKAAEVRLQAELVSDCRIKERLNALADGFSELADRTERDPDSLIAEFLGLPQAP